MNSYPKFKSKINIFRTAWPRLAARDRRLRAKWSAHNYTKDKNEGRNGDKERRYEKYHFPLHFNNSLPLVYTEETMLKRERSFCVLFIVLYALYSKAKLPCTGSEI